MSDGFPGRPKILRGALVEFGLSLPPLFVAFQFNPEQLTRNRSLGYAPPKGATAATQREFHRQNSDLLALQKEQVVMVEEQTIGFDLRLDATDRLDERDTVAEQFGIAPQLATLELMVQPKEESLLAGAAELLLGKAAQGFSFTRSANPPLLLFIFGRKRILPVNITYMNITETEFSTDLNPIRATVAVSMTVIEGKNLPHTYTKAMTEAMSLLNLANIADLQHIVIPG
ncbi:hypothetical protein [Nonomuraea sp. NPDC048826]|uniref:hypothetical protein n=1 Tax=Nonomuraea sp. NPDC048826 TaxID=3364347 RepID=UPI003718904F